MFMDYDKFDSLFYPNSIAMVGVKEGTNAAIMMRILIDGGFKGKIYPVNLSGGEVLGRKVYASVRDIPEAVDYAFLQVPARSTKQIIKDCAAKGVKLTAMFSGGLGEGEEGEGNELKQELVSIAQQGRLRLLGPNCMGFYCPAARVAFCTKSPKETGPVGVLCQSGGNSVQFVRTATHNSINFSKIVSYGNAADINETDLLEYFTLDPATKIIVAYIEGVKDGRRFFQVVRAACQAKPVIILKGGQCEASAAAAQSHTGSLAGSRQIWDSLFKQVGAIQAYSIDECLDIASALSLMKRPAGRKAAMLGFGGGTTVLAADDCYRAGLLLPPLPDTIKDELKKFVQVTGSIFTNPVDFNMLYVSPEKVARAVEVVGNWPGIDLLMLQLKIESTHETLIEQNLLYPLTEAFIKAVKKVDKPVVMVIHAIHSAETYKGFLKAQKMCINAGIPCYSSIQRMLNAIDKAIKFYEIR